MFDLLRTAVTGVNLIPTTLLGLIILYWLIVILGALDIDFFDLDLDVDISNPFYDFLAFFNTGDLPFMLVLSIFSLPFWTISMIVSVFVSTGWMNVVLIIPNVVLSLFITKAVTQPLKGVFKGILKQDAESEKKIEGQLCTLLCDLTYGRLGQAEIDRVGSSIRINVKVDGEGETLFKGDKAIVIKKDHEKDYYIIKKFEGVC